MNIVYVGSQLNSPKLDKDKFQIKTILITEQYLCRDNRVLDTDISKRLCDLVTTINGPTHIIQEACTHLIIPTSLCNNYKNKSAIRLQAVQNLTNEIIKQVIDNKHINDLTILPNITSRSHKTCTREDCQHDNLEDNVNNKWERISKLESFFYKKAEENPQLVKFASSNKFAQKYGDSTTKELLNHYIQHTRKKLEAKHKLPLPTIVVNKNRNAYEKRLFEYNQDYISRKMILKLILDTQEKHQNKDYNAQRQYTRNASYNSSNGSNSSAAYGQSSSKNYGYNDKAYYRQETSNSHGESYKNSSQSSRARSNSSRNSNVYSPKHTSQETDNQIQMIPENKIKKEKKDPEIITLEDEKLPNMQNRLSRQSRSLSPCLSYASSRECSSPPRKVREISPPSTPRESIKSPSPQRSRGKRSLSREYILETENDISFDKTMKDSEKEKHPSPSNTESSKKIKLSIENYIQQRTTEIKADMDIEHNTRVTAFQNQLEIHHDTRYAHFEKNINDIQTKTRVGIIEQVHSETRETREKAIKKAITEMQEEITTFKNKTIDSVKENFNTLQEEYKKALQEIKDTYQLDTYTLKIPQYNGFPLYSGLPPAIGNENQPSSHTNGIDDYMNDSQSTNPMEQSTSNQNNAVNSTEVNTEQEQDDYVTDDQHLKDAEKEIELNSWDA